MKIIEDNYYIDLTTYSEIYQELVYVRNEAIRWLDENHMLSRKRILDFKNAREYEKHQIAANYRKSFGTSVEHLLNRLYSHDATEALYDFQNVELGEWSDTEANRLEKELNQLQHIIFKLEVKYQLQYKLRLSYSSSERTLYLNTMKLREYRMTSLKHRLLTALYTKPDINWEYQAIHDFFENEFHFQPDDISDKSIEKAAKDIIQDVSSDTLIKDFLVVSNSNLRVNTKYLP